MRRLALPALIVTLVWLAASGCAEGGTAAPALPPTPESAAPGDATLPLTPTLPTALPGPATDSTTPLVFPSPTDTQTPAPTATPDPYWAYTIEYLQSRAYGGGELEFVETLAENTFFTRYLIRYPSDGLTIYGFLNVPVDGGPAGAAPFPVVIALHGYIDPAVYQTLAYTTPYADALARSGYVVAHPNLRGYPPSDAGDNLFRVGMAVDVLNLIAILQQSDWDGTPLEASDPARLGLWGHSMGGGIATRVMVVSQDVDAVALYAAMSGDERQNFEAIYGWSDGARGAEELAVPVEHLARISPVYFLEQVSMPVSIHHGRADELVPLRWSVETCALLTALEKNVECWYYAGMPHTFVGEGDLLFLYRLVNFFDRHLKAP